jgi:phenylacetate-coenzyme A ligase PaaK-like adenylate-forming protein
MAITQEVLSRLARLDETMADWIPPRDTWNPADEALYRPVDLYRVPLGEAQEMQLKAIRYAFTRHYNNNKFYHKYCQAENVSPDDIRTVDDFHKIPLISDATFKMHPSGKDFARWLATIFTGDLPQIVIKGANPTFDDVIDAFNAAGLAVRLSSGTSGLLSVIPRDAKTFLAAQYGFAKAASSMTDFFSDDAFMFLPNPTKTLIFTATGPSIVAVLSKQVHYAFDIDLSAELAQKTMSRNTKPKGEADSSAQSDMQRMIVNKATHWLEQYDKTKDAIFLAGPPFLMLHLLNTLQKEGKRFAFGERGYVLTGGGWKTHEDKRISLKAFRKQVHDVLGIPETHCVDTYGMTEGNGLMVQCPEGHYLHVPYTYYKPLILGKDLTPVGYGESGRFAFLDATAQSYPGFVISGDRARMLERCPVCDRPGPVLEPAVQRAKGEEIRGCAKQVSSFIAEMIAPDATDTR